MWVPGASLVRLNLAAPEASGAMARVLPPSESVTVPAGIEVPEEGLTTAFSCTGLPFLHRVLRRGQRGGAPGLDANLLQNQELDCFGVSSEIDVVVGGKDHLERECPRRTLDCSGRGGCRRRFQAARRRRRRRLHRAGLSSVWCLRRQS